ncbi:hypothetical protein SAMN05877809_102457 [Rhodobacter sp. JA431]|uniref:hypothetical protein n=1 Tax=Rhodobacter sp. JA431 TaxID=570013 RepID=UPI000BD98D24|nr:hypothetical protein [Rhodobacter sp. JA431]SOB99516.1 hypothetical protein SAMN05877809_102457 [Rhodobacter sp. JA431]
MRSFLLLPAVALLSACALPGAAPLARPDHVSLLENQLTVVLTDGSRCGANSAAMPSGMLEGCSTAYDYAVEMKRPVWVQGAEAFLEPYAVITLTRQEDGRRFVFETPKAGEDKPVPNYGTTSQ